MKTLQVSQFKARCLGLLKQVQRTGEPITVTLRGKPLATVGPCVSPPATVAVGQTLRELRHLLVQETEDLKLLPRQNRRASENPLED